jgi:tRNA dimethylallyltransferase
MKQLAIIGPTASGKSDLAIELALKKNSYILSLDSLSIYKEVDIVSAKPTLGQRAGIRHFGIDETTIDRAFSVVKFFDIYQRAKDEAIKDGKNLIIVGGSSFYLKSLISGISTNLNITQDIKREVKEISKNLDRAYSFIKNRDFKYANKISKTDIYRIEKWYEIFLSQNQTATEFFLRNERKPVIEELKIYSIDISKDELIDKIELRTMLMIKQGLIDEVFYLEKKYGRDHIAMKSIGIVETLQYLDGQLPKNRLVEQISTHTLQLAKRQITFNKSQFKSAEINIKNILKKIIDF